MKFTQWTIKHKNNKGETVETITHSKKTAVYEYIEQLKNGYKNGISELKILKNETDYTAILNKFLQD